MLVKGVSGPTRKKFVTANRTGVHLISWSAVKRLASEPNIYQLLTWNRRTQGWSVGQNISILSRLIWKSKWAKQSNRCLWLHTMSCTLRNLIASTQAKLIMESPANCTTYLRKCSDFQGLLGTIEWKVINLNCFVITYCWIFCNN